MNVRVNVIVTANQVAHVNCGNCRMLLMYQYGARSVKCAVCNFVTSVGVCIRFINTRFASFSLSDTIEILKS